jgi:hypothetical protein
MPPTGWFDLLVDFCAVLAVVDLFAVVADEDPRVVDVVPFRAAPVVDVVFAAATTLVAVASVGVDVVVLTEALPVFFPLPPHAAATATTPIRAARRIRRPDLLSGCWKRARL